MKKMLFPILLASISLLGMEEEMQSIHSSQDAAQFEEKVVVYLSTHYYFSHEEDGYPIKPGTALRAGLVTNSNIQNKISYKLERLSKKGAGSLVCGFDAPQIQKANLMMREANAEERKMILRALDAGEAALDYESSVMNKRFREALNK